MRYYIFFILLISFYLYYSLYCDPRNKYNTSSSYRYFRFDKNVIDVIQSNKPSIEIIEPFDSLFRKHRLYKAKTYKHANVIFFKLLTDYLSFAPIAMRTKKMLHIYSLRSIDILANKALLNTILSIDPANHAKYMPVTYNLDSSQKLRLFIKNFDESKLYILKKNIQRQKGCTITNNVEYIQQAIDNDYVVAQELLQDPFLINGHKINIRQYLLVEIKRESTFKLYNNGFMYYTPKPFVVNSTDKERHITTGYIDRSIYDINPLTVKELYRYLGPRKAALLKQHLLHLFEYIAEAYAPHIEKHDSNHHTNFVILGCDVAVNRHLQCKIMEINKGPDLTYKDKRDRDVKYNLVQDTLHEVGLIYKPNKNFIKLN